MLTEMLFLSNQCLSTSLRLFFLVLSTALCFAAPQKPSVRWCTISSAEEKKCNSLKDHMQQENFAFSCLQKASYLDCIKAISVSGQHIPLLGCFSSLLHLKMEFPFSHWLLPVIPLLYTRIQERLWEVLFVLFIN